MGTYLHYVLQWNFNIYKPLPRMPRMPRNFARSFSIYIIIIDVDTSANAKNNHQIARHMEHVSKRVSHRPDMHRLLCLCTYINICRID